MDDSSSADWENRSKDGLGICHGTHKLLLLAIIVYFHGWTSISFLDNSKWPTRAFSYCMVMQEMKHTYQCAASSLTSLSWNFRPMRRLKAKTVFDELTTACRFAGRPTKRSPCFVNATTDGVVRAPSAFSITRDVLPSMIDTHELVVPKSIPTTGPTHWQSDNVE